MAEIAGATVIIKAAGTAIGQVLSVDIGGYNRGTIPTTYLGDTLKTVRQSTQLDPGEITIKVAFDPADSGHTTLRDAVLEGASDVAFELVYDGSNSEYFDVCVSEWKVGNIVNEDTNNLEAEIKGKINSLPSDTAPV